MSLILQNHRLRAGLMIAAVLAAHASADSLAQTDASVNPPASSAPAPGGANRTLSMQASVLLPDGSSVELKSGNADLMAVDPAARFQVELPRLKDVRVRLFDDHDRAVSSTDRLEIGDKTRYTIAPTEPLVTGSKYTIVIDGLVNERPTDEQGQVFQVARLELKTTGEKPAAKTKPAHRKKRSR